jgi:hypothetical protein
MIQKGLGIKAMRLSRDQERAPLSDVPAGEPPRPDSAMRTDGVPGIQGGERKESPPAPLCDGTTLLRLDQKGQRVERARNILQIAGFGCLTPHVTTPCVLAGWLRCETG